jgi:hypothetical protein
VLNNVLPESNNERNPKFQTKPATERVGSSAIFGPIKKVWDFNL